MIEGISTWPDSVEQLLLPISAECPTGVSLRYDHVYDQIKEARRQDDPDLAQGIWQTELKRADWPAVSAICIDALTTRSKDLQIAAWLLEAWLHLYGLAGVQAGMALLGRLCEEFWPGLHPELQDGRLTARAAPFHWINERLSLKLKQIPITHPQTGEVPAYTWLDWENAIHFDNLVKKTPGLLRSAEAEKRVSRARFRESAVLSPTSFYVALAEQLNDTIDAVEDFEALVRRLCGDQAPGLTLFKGVLLNIRQLIATTLAERNAGDAALSAELQTAQGRAEGATGGFALRNRAEAYQQLAEIADYLARVEPHSPAPYLIKRAVSWGNMSLVDLLTELVGNPNDLRAINSLLGIKREGDV